MVKIDYFQKGNSLEGYASNLAHNWFKGILRDTGLPYTQEHLNKVALLLGELTVPSKYQEAAIAAAWLHDSAEDIKGVDVINPFNPDEHGRKLDVTYLNDLLFDAGDEGVGISFMIFLMTHRKDSVLYQDYVNRIFTFPNESPQRELHILTACLKIADRRMNLNPIEERKADHVADEYKKLEGANTAVLREFYKRTRTIDAFIKKGSFDFDIGLFIETFREAFRQKQKGVALDNLTQYLPLAERRLLVEVRDNNGLFHYKKTRDMLKSIYIDSLAMYPGTIHEVGRMGINRKASKV